MEMENALFWIWLAEALGPGTRDVKHVFDVYENPYQVFCADEREIAQLDKVSASAKAKLNQKSLDRASRILDICEKLNIGILPYTEKIYPASLREIKDAPVLLYYSGKLPNLSRTLCIGMVGTRRMSAYGLRAAYKISYELASAGAIVVSGMASGIDGVAAAAALAAKAPTIAVLGCGLDIVYPKHHGMLMEQIRENGLLLSEYPPTTAPNRYHFPVRNRLISGITQGTVVVEAGVGSGSLITARDAVQQGRKVFAVPANLGSRGADGTNELIRDGASLILSARDILDYFSYTHAEMLRVERVPKAEQSSDADLAYLHRMGVIELTQRSRSAQKTVLQAAPEEKPEKKRTSGKLPPKQAKQTNCPGSEPEQLTMTELSTDMAREKPCRESSAFAEQLTPIQLAVLSAIPGDSAIAMDALTGLGYPSGELIAALTMLEIMGLLQKLPGGMYIKV
ncbi:MAG: DNA-processing protein DprA [Clostridia bacterium]|nr:DNA-processing protein DprA [Clostridia bacterium]